MLKEMEPAGSWQCYKEVKRRWVAEGVNSKVWKSGNYALKIYKNVDDSGVCMSEKNLHLYQEITNLASEAAKLEGWTVKLPFPFGLHNVEINPFPKLIKCDSCGKWEGKVDYVSGTKLNYLPYSFISSDWASCFLSISYQIEKKFDIDGIFISPVNVRKINSSTLVITDLCDDIGALRKRDHLSIFSQGSPFLPK